MMRIECRVAHLNGRSLFMVFFLAKGDRRNLLAIFTLSHVPIDLTLVFM
jgi:hypothetical protein